MGFMSLRRFDVQARLAPVVAGISVLPLAGAGFGVIKRFNRDLGQIVYGSGSWFEVAFMVCVLSAMLLGGVAFLLGWSSAGQRRNDKPTRSWVGFFLGGAVATFGLVLLIAFYMLRLKTSA